MIRERKARDHTNPINVLCAMTMNKIVSMTWLPYLKSLQRTRIVLVRILSRNLCAPASLFTHPVLLVYPMVFYSFLPFPQYLRFLILPLLVMNHPPGTTQAPTAQATFLQPPDFFANSQTFVPTSANTAQSVSSAVSQNSTHNLWKNQRVHICHSARAPASLLPWLPSLTP